MNKLVITHVEALAVIKKLAASCSELKATNRRKHRRLWSALVVAKRWKYNMSRLGGLENIVRQRIRYSFCLLGIQAYDGAEKCAKYIVFQFLVYQYGLNMFVKKLKLLMQRIGFIQKQHRGR